VGVSPSRPHATGREPLDSSSSYRPAAGLRPRHQTLAFDQRSFRWFEACSCKPASRDLPSSLAQLRALKVYILYALVAHYLANIDTHPPDDFIKDLCNISQLLSRPGSRFGSTDSLEGGFQDLGRTIYVYSTRHALSAV
jgi:hypothetical protein